MYQIQLKNSEPVLETSTYLIDRLTSQFHAVYDDGYHQMATMLMIWSTWQEEQLVAKLNETHTHFGLPPTNTPVKKPAVCQQVPAVVIQRSKSHFQQVASEDVAIPELTNQSPHPGTVKYLEPSFSLERPVCRLKMDKRLEVHNYFISVISNKMHKVGLIYRLRKSEPHNSAHYQEQLNQQITRHNDVIHHLVDIMKTDDYFRQTEDLPQINPLTAHEEIAKFPELFDVHGSFKSCNRGRHPGKTHAMTRYVPFTSVTHSYHIWHCTPQVRFIIQIHPPSCTINCIWTRYMRIS